jgi:SAM-dependent methyltransferase
MSDDELTFTGERLHENDALFGVDVLRHRAAYQEAIRLAGELGARSVLEMGSGTGYGAAELAAALPSVVAVDRVAPLASGRSSTARFLRADLEAMPLRPGVFDLVVSFQVIEHLSDPRRFLDALAGHLKPTGIALVTTPNRSSSDGENPFHVHEYEAAELRALLETRFESVVMQGVSARGDALRYHQKRLARIRRIVRIDPLGLRRRIPRAVVEWLFARLAIVVRRGIARDDDLSAIRLEDFPIEPAHPDSLDLLAVCRAPRPDPAG